MRRLAGLWGILLFLVAHPAFALGLGAIQVRSHLNEPFDATIPVTAGAPGDLDSSTVTLAPQEEFQRANVAYADYLPSLTLSLNDQANPPFVEVKSDRIAREPYLTFLVQMRWKGGVILREYTVLLDPASTATPAPATPAASPAAAAVPESSAPSASLPPPSSASVPPPVSQPSAAPQASPVPHHHAHVRAPVSEPMPSAAPVPAPATSAASASASASGESTHNSYGPVAPGETLWSVATKVRSAFPDVNLNNEQVCLALFKANPEAFDGGRIGGLHKGRSLRIPPVSEMTALSPDAARARFRALLHKGATAAPAAAGSAAAASPLAPLPSMKAPPVSPAAPALPLGKAPAPAPMTPKPTPPPPKSSLLAPPPTPAPAPPSVAPAPPPKAAVVAPPPAPVFAPPPAPARPPPAVKMTPAAPSGPSALAPLVPASPAPPATVAPGAAVSAASVVKPAVAGSTTQPVAAPPVPASPTAATPPPAQAPGGGLPLLPIIAAGIVLFVALLGLNVMRRRRKPAGAVPAASDPFGVPAPSSAGSAAAAKPVSSAQGARPVAPAAPEGPVETLISATGAKDPAPPPAAEVNDPLADADFHIAYGLFDEAATLLRRAIERSPGRVELREKLAEVYAAARKPAEFERVVEELRGKLGPQESARIAALREKLAPTAAATTVAATGAALLREEPPLTAPQPPRPQAVETPATPKSGLSVDLTDFDAEPTVVPPPPPPRPADNRIDFSFDEPKAPPPPNLAPAAPPAAPRPASAASNVGDPLENELATKLDLARAYSDMGDNDAARSLLQEVVASASAAHRAEAEELLGRLGS